MYTPLKAGVGMGDCSNCNSLANPDLTGLGKLYFSEIVSEKRKKVAHPCTTLNYIA